MFGIKNFYFYFCDTKQIKYAVIQDESPLVALGTIIMVMIQFFLTGTVEDV